MPYQKQNLKKLFVRDRCFVWGKQTYIMGVLNVTPDSFSDGGEFNQPITALAQAHQLVAGGTDIIDIGGQSTRPGAEQISLSEELDRVLSTLEAVRKEVNLPISVDTTRAAVAKAAIQAGADIINDVSGGTFDPEMLPLVAQAQVPIILMHIRGNPTTMQKLTNYQNLLQEIYNFLEKQVKFAIKIGIDPSKIIIDPGIGFAKNYEQNIEIFQKLPLFEKLNCPILIGASRKSFIGKILNQPDPKARVWGTAAACCAAIFQGADILRVHDVQQMREVSLVADALMRTRT